MTDQGQPISQHPSDTELSDLAVGILDGRERAVVLDHLSSCAACTAELEQLTAVADSLVHMATEIEPPVGFEARVLDQLQVRPSSPTIHPPVTVIHRRWHRTLLVSAAAAVVALAFGIGWVVRPSTGSPVQSATPVPKSYVAEAALVTPGGHSNGNASVYSGHPSWLFMTVSSSAWTGSARCTITSADGTTHTIGSFRVEAGQQASWGAPLPVGADSVQKAQVIAPDGQVLATAKFA